MKKELLAKGVQFVQRKIENMDELADEGFPIVVNCAGVNGGQLAGDDDGMYPIRGILLKVDAPWQKHFLMRNFTTFTIPTIGGVFVGTVKEDHKDSMTITQEEIDYLWSRYLKLQPSFKAVHNYGHGGTGFTLGWGTAVHAAALVLDLPYERFVVAKMQSQ
ncbi:unnamed protein product [Nippostrongylus brasiliensis]|uniref:D-aspartate oxidase 3 (inferred by orthology to a C. elegans protein) n=1 Tax=Nippostrongylus brasiliensis TaxID=27835 RepID=A0A0N4XI16_NIPBR|nr:unnamed protein product [Nippostrongylus brasiliensis]